MEFFNRDITVDEQGRREELIERQTKVLNEQGREHCGTLQLVYTNDVETVTVLEAKTIINGQEYPVPATAIENKPLASDASGLDSKALLTVAFPNTRVGASLYLKYKLVVKTPPLPNYFATGFHYGGLNKCWTRSRVTVSSKIKATLALLTGGDQEGCSRDF